MSSSVLTRRGFLASALALLVARERPFSCLDHHAGARAGGHGAHHGGPHPTPRPGVTAAHVVPASRLEDEPRIVRTAFEQVRKIPAIADGIRCHCGCAEREGNRSLLSCYEGEGMARHCPLCQGQARMAFRLHEDGRTLDEIRAAIDERYE